MKKYYRDEEINKGRNVLLSIFSALIICVIVIIFGQYFGGGLPFSVFLLLIIWLSIFAFIMLGMVFLNIHNAKKNRETVELFVSRGKRVPGKIIKEKTLSSIKYKNTIFKRANFFSRGNSSDRMNIYEYTVLNVEYEQDGKKHVITTPPISFATGYLTNNKVDVYIYEDKCYVGNYNIDYVKEEKETNENNSFTKRMIISFIVFITIFIMLIVLSANKIIDGNTTKILIFVAMGSYGVVALYFSSKQMKSFFDKFSLDEKSVIEDDEENVEDKKDKK